MKKLSHTRLRRLLSLIAALALLIACFAGCVNKDPTDDKLNNLDDISTDASDQTDPTDESTAPPETDPPVTTTWGTVNTDNLNIRTSPSTDSAIYTQLAVDTRVEILEIKTVGDVTWGSIEYEYTQEDGTKETVTAWLNMSYVTLDGEAPVDTTGPDETTEPSEAPAEPEDDNSGTTVSGSGTVTADKLNIRKGADSSYEKVGQYVKGDKVTILETKDGWGRTDKGWISLKYVDTGSGTTSSGSSTVTSGSTGTITAEALYIREGAGSTYEAIGKYLKGDKVTILETKNGWGRTDKGWISLKYVSTDGSTSTGSTSTGTTSSEVVTDSNTSALGYGVVTIGALNVRTGPGTSYEDIGGVSAGERLAYFQKSGSWVRIKEGWVSTKYFYIEGTTGENAGTGTVTGDSVNLRSGPGTGFESKGKVNTGDTVEILTQVTVGGSTWGYTKNGWISMTYVKMN